MTLRWRLRFYRLTSLLRKTTVSHIGDRLAGYAASLKVFPACENRRAALSEPQSAPPSGGAVR
jgi:hypothetical protein